MTLVPNEHKYKEPAVEKKPIATDAYRVARPVIIWLLAAVGTITVGAVGAAHKTLWDHDGSIKIQGEWQKMHTEQSRKDEMRIDERLKTIEVKLDRLIELRIGRMTP